MILDMIFGYKVYHNVQFISTTTPSETTKKYVAQKETLQRTCETDKPSAYNVI